LAISRDSILKGVFLSFLFSIIAILLIIKFSSDSLNPRIFFEIDPYYLLIAAIINISWWVIKALKLKILLSSINSDITFPRIFAIFMSALFVSHVTPSSSGGFPFQVYYVHREGLPIGETSALFIFDGLLTMAFLSLITPIVFFIGRVYIEFDLTLSFFFYLSLIMAIIVLIFFVYILFRPELVFNLIRFLLGLSIWRRFFKEEQLLKAESFLMEELDYFIEGLSLMLNNRKNLFQVLLLLLFYWVFYLSLGPLLLIALNIDTPILTVIFAQLAFNFIQPFIPTPGGSGGSELSFALLLKNIILPGKLGIMVALWRFFLYYTSLVIGAIFFTALIKEKTVI